MVKHSDIIRRVGVKDLHEKLLGLGLKIGPGAIQKWADRNSIPGPYWLILVIFGVTSLEEMARAVAIIPPDELERAHHDAPQNATPPTESNRRVAIPPSGEKGAVA